MIEVYVLLSLLGIGYVINQNRSVSMRAGTSQIHRSETPSMNHLYDSTYLQHARDTEAQKARQAFESAKANPLKVVPFEKRAFEKAPTVRSSLADIDIPADEFEHNNMLPFFRGSLKQNMDVSARASTVERFTGSSDLYRKKSEQEPLFRPERHVDSVNGMPNSLDYQLDHLSKPVARKNELPFDQIRVAPGLDAGYGWEGRGGFHALNAQDVAKPKTVDELRVGSNPKVTFEGRVLDGIKEKMPGEMGLMSKNRASTVRETSEDDWFRTTGAFLKEKAKPVVEVKYTNRQDTSKEYAGPAYINKETRQRAATQPSTRHQLGSFGVGNVTLADVGTSTKGDYGKANILVYENERDVTSTRTYQGNLLSLVKAIVAPLEDAVRVTKRVHTTEHPRENGALQPQFPAKQTLYDPNQVARTTLKETTIHDADHPNISVRGRGKVYDVEDFVAKTTGRETLDPLDGTVNLATQRRAGKVHDPNDVARTTVKETQLHEAEPGPLKPQERLRGAYTETQMEARLTQKQFLSEASDYTGIADYQQGHGYQVANVDMKDTQKQFLSDHAYFGGAEDQRQKRPTSYEDVYNAMMNEVRELTLEGREPTQNSVKVANGKDGVHVEIRKLPCDPVVPRATLNQQPIAGGASPDTQSLDSGGVTRSRQIYADPDRLDSSVLAGLKSNPYALGPL